MLRSIGKQSGESAASVLKRAICIFTSFCYVTFVTFTSKAVTRGCFGCSNLPPKFHGKIRHTKTDLLLVTQFSKVTTGYPRYTHVFGSYK